LDELHRRLGARMVAFAGYEMPLQYRGIIAEHLACRAGSALFDVSHMGQAMLSDAASFERLVPSDIRSLKPGRQRYTVLLNAAGGVVDDLMVLALGGRYQLILNASRTVTDLAYLAEAGVSVTHQPERALLALQGPKAALLLPEAASLSFMTGAQIEVGGISCVITRSGYTGEDGFELGCVAEESIPLAEMLLQRGAEPAGLGARDSLRLEAGLCLYGNELDEHINPVAANLGWTIGKRRLQAWDFAGAATIRAALEQGTAEVLIGLRLEGRQPARAGALIRFGGDVIGRITSGTFGPSVNAPIALGYVRRDAAVPGTRLDLIVRDKAIPAVVSPLPFIPHRYVH
jgi:aminomethyltransferase